MSQTKAQLINAVDGSIVDADIVGMSSSKLSGTLPAVSAANLTNLPAANLTGTVADARISALTASKLTGALPAISAANLTNIPAANITGTLPAISATNLTNVPAANITGTLPAIDGSALTGISSGATGAGGDEVFVETGQTVTTSYTLSTNKNAVTISPSINSGVTITVPSGATLVILQLCQQ